MVLPDNLQRLLDACETMGVEIKSEQREGLSDQDLLQYVSGYARITRREAAELCQVSPKEARLLLARLVRRGDLAVRGARRGAYYELVKPPRPLRS